MFLTVGSRGDNRWRVRRVRAVDGGTTVGVSNASAAETPASYPLLFMPGRRQAGHFPLAALPRRLARVSFGQSGAFLNRENPQLVSRLAASPVHGGAVSQTSSISKGAIPWLNRQTRNRGGILWFLPVVLCAAEKLIGMSTVGSSEACMRARLDAVRPGQSPAHARLVGAGLSHAGEP